MSRRDVVALVLGSVVGSVLAIVWAVTHPYDEEVVR